MTRPVLLISILVLPACTDDPEPASDDASSESEDTQTDPSETSETAPPQETEPSVDDESSGGPASPFDCPDEAFAPSPLMGPGIDPETGMIVGKPAKSYVLHTTQAVINPDAAEEFDMLSGAVIAQLQSTPGLVGFSLSADANCGFGRTLGIWDSAESIAEFVQSPAHAEAMRRTAEVTLSGRFTHFDIDPGEVDVAWDLARDVLEDVEPPPLYGG